jgi:hypothetical protein
LHQADIVIIDPTTNDDSRALGDFVVDAFASLEGFFPSGFEVGAFVGANDTNDVLDVHTTMGFSVPCHFIIGLALFPQSEFPD